MATSALAQPRFDASTTCGAFFQIVGREDWSGLQEVRSYISGVMQEWNAEHVAGGQGDMMGAIDENGRIDLMSSVVAYCDRDPKRSLRSAAIEAYEDARSMPGQTGRAR